MTLGRPVQPGTIAAADFVTNTNGTVGLPRAAVPAKTWNSLPNAFTYVHGLPRALRRLVDGCVSGAARRARQSIARPSAAGMPISP
jgi:hypothetical protein